jgi:hypothetical protein
MPDLDAKDGATMIRFAGLLMTAAALTSPAATPANAQDYGPRPLRYGNTSSWHFDGRNDDRDFPTNGVFPGNSAANPPYASIGAAGFLESNPWRSAQPYPSQVVIGPAPYQAGCAQRYHSYDPASGTFLTRNGVRHRC